MAAPTLPPRAAPSGRPPAPDLSHLLAPLPRPGWVCDELGGATGAGVRVAVIDSGWDHALRLPGLRLVPGTSFVGGGGSAPGEPSPDDGDRIGHGTACIATLFRVAPGAEICPVRVFGDGFETTVPVLHAALCWAVAQRFDVISMSLWTPRPSALVPLYSACEEARQAGLVVVAAAPERPGANPVYPAVFGNVLSVGMGVIGHPFEFQYRPGAAVECLASPGDHGAMVWLGGPRDGMWGSSFAAPNVAGIAALLRQHQPSAGLDEVRALLARHAAAPPVHAESAA